MLIGLGTIRSPSTRTALCTLAQQRRRQQHLHHQQKQQQQLQQARLLLSIRTSPSLPPLIAHSPTQHPRPRPRSHPNPHRRNLGKAAALLGTSAFALYQTSTSTMASTLTTNGSAQPNSGHYKVVSLRQQAIEWASSSSRASELTSSPSHASPIGRHRLGTSRTHRRNLPRTSRAEARPLRRIPCKWHRSRRTADNDDRRRELPRISRGHWRNSNYGQVPRTVGAVWHTDPY